MPHDLRAALSALEHAPAEEAWTALAYVAGRRVELDQPERNAALRRAELLLAAGGDPHRPFEPFGRAATALAADLDRPEARAALAEGLQELEADAAGLPATSEALRLLLADPELAWRCYAAALLAEELGEGEE